MAMKDIQTLAREAGFARYMTDGEINWQMFERFAALVREDEREKQRGLEYLAEEAECVRLSLDKANIPTADAEGAVYSLWGRVCRFVEQNHSGEAADMVQEPVAWGEVVLREGDVTVSGYLYGQLPVGTKLYTAPPTAAQDVSNMVNRFLGWKLPKDFAPDGGISFDREYSEKWGMPVGTHLFTADQAKQMFEHCLSVTPTAAQDNSYKALELVAHTQASMKAHAAAAARQMRDAAVKVVHRFINGDGLAEPFMSDIAEAIAALPIPGEDK